MVWFNALHTKSLQGGGGSLEAGIGLDGGLAVGGGGLKAGPLGCAVREGGGREGAGRVEGVVGGREGGGGLVAAGEGVGLLDRTTLTDVTGLVVV